jgi:hypothetical protein
MLVGHNHSSVPEGSPQSLMEIQNQLTIDREKSGRFFRLLWIPPGLQVEDDRQSQFIELLRQDPNLTEGSDLMETYLEDLRTAIYDKLKRPPAPEVAPAVQAPVTHSEGGSHPSLYVIHDQRDTEAAALLVDHLYDHFEVLQSVFEGDEAEIREYHDENLRNCDGVVILYGSTNELWVRRKLREIQKAPGYGRTKPAPTVGIVVAGPRTAEKERFRTHDAMVLPQFEGISPDSLEPFVAKVKG